MRYLVCYYNGSDNDVLLIETSKSPEEIDASFYKNSVNYIIPTQSDVTEIWCSLVENGLGIVVHFTKPNDVDVTCIALTKL